MNVYRTILYFIYYTYIDIRTFFNFQISLLTTFVYIIIPQYRFRVVWSVFFEINEELQSIQLKQQRNRSLEERRSNTSQTSFRTSWLHPQVRSILKYAYKYQCLTIYKVLIFCNLNTLLPYIFLNQSINIISILNTLFYYIFNLYIEALENIFVSICFKLCLQQPVQSNIHIKHTSYLYNTFK